MKDKRLEEKPACSVKSAPFPTEVICTQCGHAVEVWSDEPESRCSSCGCTVENRALVNH
ncbi:MAG: hypothetical protein JSU90_00610 [Nitrospiraceae bacterium]|nr:MAG: hypothetical protein JSU90_00610 [Nitrospiraceae bacterium]